MVDIGSVAKLSWCDAVLFLLLIYVIYLFFFKKSNSDAREIREDEDKPILPPMPKRDFTVEELLPYDGVQNERILLAVCGKVFDVTKGTTYYGPEGPYSKLAGHDATRALSTMHLSDVKDTPDDISDIPESDLSTAREWAQSFTIKYPVVGRLLAEGEKPTDYNDELASL